jgi:hypothetical protein
MSSAQDCIASEAMSYSQQGSSHETRASGNEDALQNEYQTSGCDMKQRRL